MIWFPIVLGFISLLIILIGQQFRIDEEFNQFQLDEEEDYE